MILVRPLLRSGARVTGVGGNASLCVRSTTSRPPMQHNVARRSFHPSSVVRLSSKTIQDPDHPTGIYFHPIPQQGRYAISMLPTPPSSPSSASIIGFIGDVDEQGKVYEVARQQPGLVQDNPAFLNLLHEALRTQGVPSDGLLEYEAHLRQDGFAHVADPRHQLMPGRIPTPENIIAMVAFTEGTVRPETYERNDTYRIITHEEGFIQLRGYWQDAVFNRCKEEN